MLIGGASKVVAAVATYPYQVIKSKLQQRENEAMTRRYLGTFDCIVKVWKYDGLVGFFRGVFPNVVKVVPSSAVTFLVYEETMKFFKSSDRFR
jgi:solute carrier family 25 folate transporter 32